MPAFNFKARSDSGELITGEIEAQSADGVASQLLSRGVTPVSINERIERASLNIPDIFPKKVDIDELVLFSRQMHSLTRAGVPINSAMRSLSQSSTNELLQEALEDIEVSLNSGVNLATAMRKHERVFDDLYVNMIAVGENSGRLDLAFKQLGQYMELERDTRRRIGSALRYPSFVFGAIGAAMVILNIWVIPVFADLFAKFNTELPLPTKVLIGTSNAFVNHWPLMLLGALGIFFGLRHYLGTEKGALLWDEKKLGLPILGTILERAMLGRFARSFSLMLASGVPLIQSLELCAQAVGNSYLGMKIRDMRGNIERGESLLRTATRSEMFTPLVLQMIQVGEETGKVDELLEEVAYFYEQEVDHDLKNLASYIEPIMIAAIAGLVMMLALGIFLPMWDMYGAMSR
jgi:MSHA biogenesis protein MshG